MWRLRSPACWAISSRPMTSFLLACWLDSSGHKARHRHGTVAFRRGPCSSMVPLGDEMAARLGRKMHTLTTAFNQGPLSRIVALAADVERWPQILPHYRWVTLLEGGGDRKVVEMVA